MLFPDHSDNTNSFLYERKKNTRKIPLYKDLNIFIQQTEDSRVFERILF